jgi:hypothetical protein
MTRTTRYGLAGATGPRCSASPPLPRAKRRRAQTACVSPRPQPSTCGGTGGDATRGARTGD